MKKQSGFTLIELLLVLAIIGIISAIAIPALLSQRARARDKAAIENLSGTMGDLVGQFDKYKEQGLSSTAIKASMIAYLNANHSKDKNPWSTSGGNAFASTLGVGTGSTQATFASAMTNTTLGQVKYYIKIPTGSGGVGFIGGVVKLNNQINNSANFRKVTAIE